jgi:hypothetical protein
LLFVRIPIIIIIKTTHHYLYPKNTLIIHVFLHLSIKNTKAIRGEKLKYPGLQKKEGPERDAKNIGGVIALTGYIRASGDDKHGVDLA